MIQKLCKLCLAITMMISMLPNVFMQNVKAVEYGNLALNKTVSASSTHATKNIAYAVDGKVASKETWQIDYATGSEYNRGNGDLVEDFTIDLGASYYINQIDITWTATVWAKYVKVEGSLDGVTYTTIKEVSDNSISADQEKQVISFDLTSARYVKLTFNEPNNKTYGYEFYEVEVYGSDQIEGNINIESLYETIKNIPPTISQDGTSLVLPTLEEEGYQVKLYGSSNESVIGLDGTIYQPLENKKVYVSYKVEKIDHPEQNYFNNYDEVSIVIPGIYSKNESDNEKPIVLPEISEWKGNEGNFVLTNQTRIVMEDESLLETANVINEYFEGMLNKQLEIVVGEAKEGDIYFTLSDKKELGNEGYLTTIDDKVIVEAYDEKGLLYGGTTLVQILSQDANHEALPKGMMRDYPAFKVRSMMIDVGRYYIPLEYIKEITKYMAYFKMSEVHIHLNDNGGEQSYAFRLESKKYPQINSNLDPDHVYKQDEYRAYQKEMKKYGIDVITEIDSPAHSGFLKLYNSSYLMNNSHMDLSKPEVTEFMKSLFDEYLDGDDPVIQSKNFHIGVDEYPAEYSDLARQYCDELIKHVKAKGYDVRMWGAFGSSSGLGGTYPVSTDVICNYWSPNFSDPQSMIEQGYEAINNNRTYLYEVPSSDLDRNKFSVTQGWENWDVIDVPGVTLSNSTPVLHGAESAFWYDNEAGYSEFDSFNVLKGMALLIAEKAWVGKTEDKEAKEFNDTIELLGKYTPTANPERYVESKTEEIVNYDFEDVQDHVVKDLSENGYDATLNNLTIKEENGNKAVELDGNGYLSLPFDAKGFNYTVSFDLFLDGNQQENAILFDGVAADGTLYLNYNNTGKLAFVRKGYEFTFDYELPINQTNHIVLTCDEKETILYVNGIKVSSAIASSNAGRTTTFVLPTEKIGSGIVGTLDNFVLMNRSMSYDELLGFEDNTVTNLALNKPTTVSGLETDDGRFTSDLAVDGDTSTRVSFEKVNEAWFIVDLEDTYWIESLEIEFGEYPNKYQLYVSEDGNEWTMIHEDLICTGGSAGTYTQSFVPAIKARYVKYQQLEMFTASNGRNYSGNFNEFRVWGSKENIIQDILQEAKDILANKEVNDTNEAFLEQLSNSVTFIETKLETTEELKLACNQLLQEVDKFNNGTILETSVEKDELAQLLNNKVTEGISNESLYDYYYKQAIIAFINSDATQEEVEDLINELNILVYTKNLALNGDIISSNGLNPTMINDGLKPARGNYWDSDGDASNSSIVVKLTQPAYLDKIVVIPYYYRSDYYYNYEVFVSDDNENWTSLAKYIDKTGNYSVAGQTFTFDEPMLVEYVKVQGIESNNNNKIHIVELEAYALVLPGANKARLQQVLEQVQQLDVSLYTEESYNSVLNRAGNAKYIYDDEEATQDAVDEMVMMMNDVIRELEYRGANYQAVEDAIFFANTIKDLVKDFTDIQAAIDAVEYDKDIRYQDEVDAYAQAIEDALLNAQYKDANYDAVDEAITQASALNKEDYVDFTNVEAAINAVVRGKDIRYQDEVDAMAKAIQDAIKTLEEKPKLVAPNKVENLVAQDTNYKTITLTWDAVETATSYDVYRKSYKEGATFEYEATVSEPTYESVGVMTGKEYAFYVVAKNEAGEAEASEEVVMTTTLKGSVTLAMEQVSTSKFKLSWNKVDGATRYIVYRKRNDDKMLKVLTLGGNDLEYVTAEMPNGDYTFQVRAGRYDSKDRVMTKASNKVNGSVEALKPSVTATAGSKSAKISWKKMEGVTHYQVYRATSSTGKYTKLTTTKELSYTAKSLTKGKKYYFKVRGYKTYKSGTELKYSVYTPYSSVKTVTAK